MNGLKTARTCFVLFSLAVVLATPQGFARQNSAASTTGVQSADRDGQHDFDPLLGSWKFHIKKLMHPLTGSTTWVEFDGTGVCYKLWDGRSQLDTIEVYSPDARPHRRSDLASIRSSIPSVASLLGKQQNQRSRPTPDRRIQEWTRRVLRPRYD